MQKRSNQSLRPIRNATIQLVDEIAKKTELKKVEIYHRAVKRFYNSEIRKLNAKTIATAL